VGLTRKAACWGEG